MINIIVAMSYDGIIGIDGKLPWHIPSDLQRFKKLTTGNIVLMGRKTYESIDPPLRNRTVIVATKQSDYKVVNGFCTAEPEKMIEKFKNDELFIIGGAEIYKQFLPIVDTLYTTIINTNIDTTQAKEIVYFPEYDLKEWRLVYREAGYETDYIVWKKLKEEECYI